MKDRAILLIEDNPDDRELALRALKRCRPSVPVVVIDNGADAIEYLCDAGSRSGGRSQPALVLLDLKMPKLDGIEVLRKLRASHKNPRVPIVVMTSSTEARDITAAYEHGATSYVTKPVDYCSFLELVDCLCRYWLDFNHSSPA
jgi:two-component system response regulator